MKTNTHQLVKKMIHSELYCDIQGLWQWDPKASLQSHSLNIKLADIASLSVSPSCLKFSEGDR